MMHGDYGWCMLITDGGVKLRQKLGQAYDNATDVFLRQENLRRHEKHQKDGKWHPNYTVSIFFGFIFKVCLLPITALRSF